MRNLNFKKKMSREEASEEESRHRTRRLKSYVRQAGEKSLRPFRREPLCLRILKNVYHKYGLKHLVLILVLAVYTWFGAGLFLLIEEPEQQRVEQDWRESLANNRTKFVGKLMREIFNNSENLLFLTKWQESNVRYRLFSSMRGYEAGLGIRYTDQKIEWDYWNAMLYCGTIFTTIGYGLIYPRTNAGRILTMIYALGGIPLVLLILQDVGRLLTLGMKFPWFQFKRAFRRVLRYVTKQSREEMMEIERIEKENLNVFDLPLPVAVALIIGWIFLCSATFCIWEKKWSYVEAFYFFFISLSTVGLGDLTPNNPRLLLMMFGFIMIGLSLVSMVINLIQINLEKTYEAGKIVEGQMSGSPHSFSEEGRGDQIRSPILDLHRVTLGIFQSIRPTDSLPEESSVAHRPFSPKQRQSQSTQTVLSFPVLKQMVWSEEGLLRWYMKDSENGVEKRSPDAVTRLVESDSEVLVMSDMGEEYEETEELKKMGRDGSPLSLSAARLLAHADLT